MRNSTDHSERKVLLHDPDRADRRARKVRSLLADLATGDVVVRRRARGDLVALGETALPAMLEELAHGGFQVRWEVAKTLGEMQLPGAVPGLIAALEDEEQDVRWLAAVALARTGGPAVEPLLRTLDERPDDLYLRQGVHHFLTMYTDQELRNHLQEVRDALGPFENGADVVPVNKEALKAVKAAGS